MIINFLNLQIKVKNGKCTSKQAFTCLLKTFINQLVTLTSFYMSVKNSHKSASYPRDVEK
jgi:hypothetical protein